MEKVEQLFRDMISCSKESCSGFLIRSDSESGSRAMSLL